MSKAIAYILNPEKTDEKLLVSSYGCASETAAREFEWTRKIAEQKGMNPVRIIARHVIQSFEIGEVTPELAHEIGKQFADEILGGKYEYVLTTHIDKDHVHNHLIFNAVDFVDYHAYKSYKRIYYDMREVSDRLCKENGLSVIPPSQNKGMGYKEYTEAKRGTSWKQKLKQTIDRLVITAKDYDDFLRLMQEAGYEIKTGKYISFRAEGQERFTRSKTIGENYTEERIKERIAGRTPRRSQRQATPKGISLIGDIQERIRLIDSRGYEYKAKLTILKEAARRQRALCGADGAYSDIGVGRELGELVDIDGQLLRRHIPALLLLEEQAASALYVAHQQSYSGDVPLLVVRAFKPVYHIVHALEVAFHLGV